MVGSILGIIIGGAAIVLGMKGFTQEGLPFTQKQRLTGPTAKLIGVICILIGLAFIALSAYPFIRGA